MTQIRDSRGRIVANVDGYQGAHRVTYMARHAFTDTRVGPVTPNDGAHAARCGCEWGYVCLTHRIAR